MHSIEAAILVHASAEECYARWLNFESFPHIMKRVLAVRSLAMAEPGTPKYEAGLHIPNPQQDFAGTVATEVMDEIAKHGNRLWHWEVQGPLNHVYTWDAGIVQDIPHKTVSWATTPNQEIPNTGTVNFLSFAAGKPGEEKTLVEVKMSFSAPGGIVGEFLSDILHYGDNLLCEALEEFKSFVESRVAYVPHVSGHIMPPEKPMAGEAEMRDQLGSR